MGYSKSKKAIKRMKVFLDTIADNNLASYVWDTGSVAPDKFAYKLREAFYACQLHREAYPQYADFKDKYEVLATANKVIVRLREDYEEEATRLKKNRPAIKISGIRRALEIVNLITIQGKDNNYHFPDASLSETEINKLKKWCGANSMSIIVKDDNDGVLINEEESG